MVFAEGDLAPFRTGDQRAYHLPDRNEVFYSVYLRPPSAQFTEDGPASTGDRLRDARAQIHAELAPLLETYFWHCEPFRLSVVENDVATEPGYPFLRGSTLFGDCIEDEWFVVYLLLRISEMFLEAVISVHDNDGEFLLIEAANALPKHVNPNNTTNRVFLHRGTLHLIPLPATSAEQCLFPVQLPGVARAVEIIRFAGADTRAPPEVAHLALARTRDYPGKIAESFHRAKCLLPRRVAVLLREDPKLVTAAVNAFYTRDSTGMKACQKMVAFPPSTMLPSPTLVKFTKPTYAQLVSQKFHPPRSFQLPPRSDKTFAAAELGMKLTCGFEILVAKSRFEGTVDESPTFETYAFESDARWKAFIGSLTKYGYFKDEMPGSRQHRELEQLAKKHYLHDLVASGVDDGSAMAFRSHLRRLLSLPLLPNAELTDRGVEDDDSWMEVTPADLETLLAARCSDGSVAAGDVVGDLGRIADSFRAFVEKGSGLEGAEFPGEDDSDEEWDSEDELQEGNSEKFPAETVNFDPDAFVSLMQRTLGVSDEEMKSIRPSRQAADDAGLDAVASGRKRAVSFSPDLGSVSEISSMEEVMAQMDAEVLSEPKIRRTFETSAANGDAGVHVHGGVSVNVDLAVIENVLESFNAQQGLPGPAGNILGRMGIALPRDEPGDSEESPDT